MSSTGLFWAMSVKVETPFQRLVLSYMANHARGRTLILRQETIAKGCLISSRKLRDVLSELEVLGLIARRPRYHQQKGHRVADEVRLNIPGDLPEPRRTALSDGDDQPTFEPPLPANGSGSLPEPRSAQYPSLFPSIPSSQSEIEKPAAPKKSSAKEGGGPDYAELIFNQDAPALAKIAGCSLAQAKKRIGAILKAEGYERKRVHEALVQTIKAEPAGDVFAYALNVSRGAKVASRAYVV